MPTLTVMLGVPGSGKSTWIAANQRPDQVICSTERMRTDVRLTHQSGALVAYLSGLQRKARRALAGGHDVLIDGCNTRRQERSRWLNVAREQAAVTHLVVVDTPLATALAAQRTRAHPVPEDKVAGYYQDFTQALAVIESEGWQHITYVRRDGYRSTPIPPIPRDMRRPTAHRRGYDVKHRKIRAQVAPLVNAGGVTCWRCGKTIETGSEWDLGHDDNDRTIYRGPEHRACNRATKGRDCVNPEPRVRSW